MEGLEQIQHRAILLIEESPSHMHLEVWTDAEKILIEGAVVDRAETQAVQFREAGGAERLVRIGRRHRQKMDSKHESVKEHAWTPKRYQTLPAVSARTLVERPFPRLRPVKHKALPDYAITGKKSYAKNSLKRQ
jgi:hypothetical protein